MLLIMLQLRDLPTPEILDKFATRYPDADVSAVASFLFLLRVATDISIALDACLSQHGLLQGRWWVLILLMREDNVTSTPSLLAEKIGVSRATMTGLIDGLEQDNLVKRVFTKKDRRSVQIQLTHRGQAKLDEVMPDYYKRVRKCMRGLSVEQKTQLQQLLSQVSAGVVELV